LCPIRLGEEREKEKGHGCTAREIG